MSKLKKEKKLKGYTNEESTFQQKFTSHFPFDCQHEIGKWPLTTQQELKYISVCVYFN